MALKTIVNSAIFDYNAGTPNYFDRTPPGAPTDTAAWTFSTWVKRSGIGTAQTIFSAGTNATNYTSLEFDSSDRLNFTHFQTITVDEVISEATFRDPTAWYHVVIRYDSAQATAADRITLWVNNVEIVDFDAANYPGLSGGTDINSFSPQEHNVGRRMGPNDQFFDGIFADMYFCDGETLDPTTFGEDNNGVWQPITASPTFGSEGFFFEFGTGGQLGDDTSGNVNDYNENGFFSSNQREDSPTQNYLGWNSQYLGTDGTPFLSFGATRLHKTAGGTGVTAAVTAALPKTGKYYWEYEAVALGVDAVCAGIIAQPADLNQRLGDDNFGWGLYNPAGTTLAVRHDGGDTNFTDTSTILSADYLMVAYNADTGDLWFGREGTWFDSGDPELGLLPHVTLTEADRVNGPIIPAGSVDNSTARLDFRAAAEDFEGTIPNGFTDLDVSNWPNPSVERPTDYFDILSWNGDSTNPRSFTGLAFQPDLAWVKNIFTPTTDHVITDIIKGAGVSHIHNTGSVDDVAHPDGDIATLTPDGITVDATAGADLDVNDVIGTYLGFAWKEDVLAGLDLVGYAGSASPQAISHALGGVPDVMYIRNRDSADSNTGFWRTLLDTTPALVADPETDYTDFDVVNAVADSSTRWNDVAPTDTEFTVGADPSVNSNGENHAAYLWREIEGFSKFGVYQGTGAADSEAPFIYCGFRPKWMLIKSSNAAVNWVLMIPTRYQFAGAVVGGTDIDQYMFADTTGVVTGSNIGDVCASGLKIKSTLANLNIAGEEYHYMMFAEMPFKFASAHSEEKFGDGDIELDIELGGTGDNPNQFGDGDVDLSFLLTGDGSGGTDQGDGGVELAFELGGTGTAQSGRNGDGFVELRFEVDATAENVAIRGAAVTLPQLTSNGQIAVSVPTFGTVTLPALTTVATMVNAIATFGSPRLPILQTSGEINPETNIVLPVLQTTGTLITGAVLNSLIVLPRPTTNGIADSPIVLVSSSVILPQLRTPGATITSGSVITIPVAPISNLFAQTTLPALTANGFLLIPQEMGGTVILPALDVAPDAILAPGAIVTGSVTLPLLRLESILVNGATLAATVWVMNTETLETTNYLDYDFNSLVSFADQPYGVTSAGIFLLEGDDDDGTDIDSRILTGISDRGDENLKEAAQMYMQYEGGSMMFQLLPDGQQRLREYRFERRSNSSGVIHARAKGSRGLRSRSWQMGLRNLGGQDFTLDKLGLLLRQLTRKTRKN